MPRPQRFSWVGGENVPRVQVGGVSLPRLILGHLPFVGVSYQGAARDAEYRGTFSNVENTVKMVETALGLGVDVVGVQPEVGAELSVQLLRAVREASSRSGVEVGVIPCFRVPLRSLGKPVDDYRRWLTYYLVEAPMAGEGILDRYLGDPILQFRASWRENLLRALSSSAPYRAEEVTGLEVDYERLEADASLVEGQRVLLTQLGSECDLLLLTDRADLLSEALEWARSRFSRGVLVASHHAGSTFRALSRWNVNASGHVTPVNPLGVMMHPTREMAEEAILSAEKPVLAIKPLAGGRAQPQESFDYVYRVMGVEACMVGAASPTELGEDLQAALKALKRAEWV